MAGLADGGKTGRKTRGNCIPRKDGVGGKRFFVVVGGIVKGRGDLPETGIVLVITKKPDGIFVCAPMRARTSLGLKPVTRMDPSSPIGLSLNMPLTCPSASAVTLT